MLQYSRMTYAVVLVLYWFLCCLILVLLVAVLSYLGVAVCDVGGHDGVG